MANNRDDAGRAAAAAVKFFLGLPPAARVAVVVLVLVAGGVFLVVAANRNSHATHPDPTNPPAGETAGRPGTPAPPVGGPVVFMFWNVENLFDDVDDRRRSVDEPYDNWFARDAATRQLKYDRLAEVILKVNGGKGPDLLACVEVESPRAAELLRDALNAKLPAGAVKYSHVAMKDLDAGRHMAPCLISRLPLDDARTRLLGRQQRVLEVHVVANGHDLCLVASHWTSQLSDDGSSKGGGRSKYAATIYAEYEKVVGADPAADFLVCGDFNDTPDSESVAHGLHMTANRSEVTPTRTAPKLLGLLSDKPADKFGTHYYNRPLIYDHVGVSAGMLDAAGWSCDPASVQVVTDGLVRDRARVRRPWRFGGPNDDAAGRGYSDHFPVVVNLAVAPPKP